MIYNLTMTTEEIVANFNCAIDENQLYSLKELKDILEKVYNKTVPKITTKNNKKKKIINGGVHNVDEEYDKMSNQEIMKKLCSDWTKKNFKLKDSKTNYKDLSEDNGSDIDIDTI